MQSIIDAMKSLAVLCGLAAVLAAADPIAPVLQRRAAVVSGVSLNGCGLCRRLVLRAA